MIIVDQNDDKQCFKYTFFGLQEARYQQSSG